MRDYFKIREDGDGNIISRAQTQGLYPDDSRYSGPYDSHRGVADSNDTVVGNTLIEQGTPLVSFRSGDDSGNWSKRNAIIESFAHLPYGIPPSLLSAMDDAVFWVYGNYGRADIYARPLLCRNTLIHYNTKPAIAGDGTDESHKVLLSNGGALGNGLIFYHPVTWTYYYVGTPIARPELSVSISTGDPTWNVTVLYGTCALEPAGGHTFVKGSVSGTGYAVLHTPTPAASGHITSVRDMSGTNADARTVLVPEGAIESAVLESESTVWGTINQCYRIPFAYSWNSDTNELLNNFLSRAGWTAPSSSYTLEDSIITCDVNDKEADRAGHMLEWIYSLEDWYTQGQRYWTPYADQYEAALSSGKLGDVLWPGRYARGGKIYAAVGANYFRSNSLPYTTGGKVVDNFRDIATGEDHQWSVQWFFYPSAGDSWSYVINRFNAENIHPWLAYHEEPLYGVDFYIQFTNMVAEVFGSNLAPKLHLEISGDWDHLTTEGQESFRADVTIYTDVDADHLYLESLDGYNTVVLNRGTDSDGLCVYSASVAPATLLGDKTSGDFPLYYPDGSRATPRILVTDGFFYDSADITNLDAEATYYPLNPH